MCSVRYGPISLLGLDRIYILISPNISDVEDGEGHTEFASCDVVGA